MARDWLLGADRHDAAADHIYAAVAELITRRGFDGLDVDTVARHAHCSRATVYRHTGGVTHLRETVLARAANRIAGVVESALGDLTGSDRVSAALTVTLHEVRSDPIVVAFLASQHGPRSVVTFAESPALIGIVSDMLGTPADDPLVGIWFIRSVLSLLLWPTDAESEAQLLQRFLIPALHPRDDDRRPEGRVARPAG
ncbi:TetR/AcrR family transcriptional regulator [Nocardia flavorosea]|uniref:TetR/AcrR family transcriptional regulator n=1 Tax=Nocardia flavorosea TaxID=53429 RepID=A0A846YK47_9NOCA|nr:TetR/AcrR family transcriptional regulator [Nocardia flavorosea]NKY59243.1 TetR/AcrR family transcriptional regulator [Nocardia flavorosea]